MTKEEDVTRNLSVIEYYKQQLESIDMQIQYLQAAIADSQKGKMTLEHIHDAEKNADILIPVGGGAFVNGSVTNVSKALIGIGAGLVAEKTMTDAISKIDERIKKLQENEEKMFSLAQRIQTEAQELSQKTQQMMEEAQQ